MQNNPKLATIKQIDDKLAQTENQQLKIQPKQTFINPICKQTYKALPKIYGRKKKHSKALTEPSTDKKKSDMNNLSVTTRNLSTQATKKSHVESIHKITRKQINALSQHKKCQKKNCPCRIEEQKQAKKKTRIKFNSTTVGRMRLPQIHRFQLEDLQSKHKVSTKGLLSDGCESKGIQSIIKQKKQKAKNQSKQLETASNNSSKLINFFSTNNFSKTYNKIFQAKTKIHAKINRVKFQISEEQVEESSDQYNQSTIKYTERYRTQQNQSPGYSKSVLINNQPIFNRNKNKTTKFGQLNKSQRVFEAPSLKNSKQYPKQSNSSFRVPQQKQFMGYISAYSRINKDFDLKKLFKSPNFKIVKFQQGVYFGQVDDNLKKNGYGVQVTKKQIFEGRFQDDLKVQGFEKNIDGIYYGDYKNGVRSGFGVFQWNNGERFQGNWEEGVKCGYGVWTSPKNDKYQGEWLHNRQHGQGIFKHKNSVYKGTFKNFFKDGKGQQIFSNGDIYRGQYRRGKPHGNGYYQWKARGNYEGEFCQGMRQGYGRWIDSDNTIYQAQANLRLTSSMGQVNRPLQWERYSKVNSYKANEKIFYLLKKLIKKVKFCELKFQQNCLSIIFIHKFNNIKQNIINIRRNMKKSLSISCKSANTIGNYQIIKHIGKGLTAEVFEAVSRNSEKVSIKTISSNFYKSQIGSQLIKNEIKILSSLKHPNILKFIQKVQEGGKVHIVTCYCEGGDLQSYINKNKKLDQKKSIQMIKCIVEGCVYLRSHGIVHRDLKPSNIFLLSQVPIIADFGFAVHESNKNLMKLNAGSPLYMPLQSLARKQFSQKSDVFAAGVCLYEMLTGKTPWEARSQKQLMQKMKTTPKLPQVQNKNINKLLLACLSHDQNERPTFQKFLEAIKRIQNNLNDQKHLKQRTLSNLNITQIKQKTTSCKIIKKMNVIGKQNAGQMHLIATQRCNQKVKPLTFYKQQKISKNQRGKLNTSYNNRKSQDFLNVLNPDQFKFLPQSIIIKFKLILLQYKRITGGLKVNFQNYTKLHEKDVFVQQIQNCNTQNQLCKTIEGFIRRLFRLTKNYKQYGNCLKSLEKLYERVTTINI